jgi:aminoglycoside 3-N-acetyltransferase
MKKNMEYFKHTLRKLELSKKRVLYLHISTSGLKEFKGSAYEMLSTVLDIAGDSCTIVMNCFSWTSFCQQGSFNIHNTPCEVGVVNEIFRRLDGVIRSKHPIYSLCMKGPMAGMLARHDGSTCFGPDTPFQAMLDANAYCLHAGLHILKGNTLVHTFEELKKVPYREFKEFKGTVDFGNGSEEYKTEFYVRKSQDISYGWEPAIKLLKQRGLIDEADDSISGVFAQDVKSVFFELLDINKEVFLTENAKRNSKGPARLQKPK